MLSDPALTNQTDDLVALENQYLEELTREEVSGGRTKSWYLPSAFAAVSATAPTSETADLVVQLGAAPQHC